jgi:hypothetical protein
MASFSDDFNRADSTNLGANWTEAAGFASIATNRLSLDNVGFGTNWVVTTAAFAATQYVKVTFADGPTSDFPQIVLRYADGTSAFYAIEVAAGSGGVDWYNYVEHDPGTAVKVDEGALAVADGDTIGVTVEGTGNNTTVRVWRNPAGLPSAADDWNGDTTPDVTMTGNPPAPADAGTKVGVGGFSSTPLLFDDFFAGDLAAAAAASRPPVPTTRVPAALLAM